MLQGYWPNMCIPVCPISKWGRVKSFDVVNMPYPPGTLVPYLGRTLILGNVDGPLN